MNKKKRNKKYQTGTDHPSMKLRTPSTAIFCGAIIRN